jgi:hypothetical protein
MMRYGYARVSSNSQDYNGQVDALKAAGCERIFSEKMSGKSTNGRREFERLIRALVPGDTVVVTKLQGRPTLTRALHKSGRKLYVEMTFAIVKNDAGDEVPGSVAVTRDVTDRVERERAANRSS